MITIDYMCSVEELQHYLKAKGWVQSQMFWQDPEDPTTWQPLGEAQLIQMRRDGLETPEEK